ncbi:MarR family winged helix-turn-helix transcriptional regulator [Desulfosediminicola flagellatus]|uniref:MarR family winged helix-turn-helix transcriptional regulator n=1 Tax=Desulfosediminicola flagellatus TaxID=2569541 RepID=UPI0010AD1501|nr:MarR family winged helix-turn-helix transcriptional regulator [Desulfosediminicola flagellatus]
MSQSTPDDVAHVEELSHQLVEFYDKINSWEHSVVKGSGLSPAQMHTIEVIGHHQDMRMKELAERLGVTTGTLTVAVDKLERKGLVERKPHHSDRRSWFVALTAKGQAAFAQHDRFHNDFTKDISEGLTNKEITMFSSLLSKLLNRM